jgi:hypothetical protein
MTRFGQAPYNQAASTVSTLANGSWCNPPGSGAGKRPTTSTGDELVDAYLWIKTVGESDGQCNAAGGVRAWDYSLYTKPGWPTTATTQAQFDPLWGRVDPAAGAWFPEQALELARLAAQLKITVRGLSFHVGSQTPDPAKHVEAIGACGRLIHEARREHLGEFDTLDIGGGFPIAYLQPAVDIRRFCAPIRAALAKLPYRVRVIAEPGRFIVGPAAIGVASVMGRAQREGHWWYYLDDGLYGSYSGQIYDHARYPVEPLRSGTQKFPSVLAGPTCDSIDVIAENLLLPHLKAGDLIIGKAMGAYTWASASEFNFFPKATVVAVNSEPGDLGHVRMM